MTRPRAHRVDELSRWPRPFVSDLRCAPELAVLAVLHTAVRAALVALAAEHQTLADLGPPDEPRPFATLAHLSLAMWGSNDAVAYEPGSNRCPSS